MIDRKDCSYLDIRRIDTRRVYIKPEGPLYPHQMVIQPGEHLLVVTYWKGYVPRTANHYRLTQEIQLNITAKAHHNYELKYRILSEDSISVWAEDIETGDIVSDVVTAQVEERSPSPFQPVPIPMPITRR